MADMMQFDLVSPERSLVSVQASEVQIPGSEGDLTAMPDHAPVITTLRPGILRVVGKDGTQEFAVTGGFAEITPGATSVLAEHAMPVADMTQDDFDAMMTKANAAKGAATSETQDAVEKQLHDLAAMGSEIGLTAKSA